jgi:hypothetical protein
MPTPTNAQPAPSAELAAAQRAADDLAAALCDEGPYTPDLTRVAAVALNTTASYLRLCLTAAQPVATPSIADLAEVVLALHMSARSLATAVRGAVSAIDRRALPANHAEVHLVRVAATRIALDRAVTALRAAATAFGDAHQEITS